MESQRACLLPAVIISWPDGQGKEGTGYTAGAGLKEGVVGYIDRAQGQ